MTVLRQSQPTLQYLLDAVAGDPAIPSGRKPSILSSLRKLARMLDRPLDRIRVDSTALLGFLDTVEPALHAISRKRPANIRSDIRLALEVHGLLERRWIHAVQPSPAWRNLLALISGDRYARTWLLPFARFCSSAGVQPAQVDAPVSEAYLAARSQEGVASARTTHQNTVRRWNAAVAEIPGWPQRPLLQPCYLPARRTLPDADFPVSLIEERGRYLERLSTSHPFDRNTPPRAYRPATIRAHRAHIRMLASALAMSGYPIADITSLAVLAAHARGIATALREQAERRKRPSVAHPLATLLAIGKYWLRLPKEAIDELKLLHRSVRPPRQGMTGKNDRLVHRVVGDAEAEARFFRLPFETMERLRRANRTRRNEAIGFQRAMMCELLLHTAMRVRNLAELHLDRHFAWMKSGACRIVIPGEQVKNGRELAFELPPEVAGHLRLYLDRFRPLLAAPGDDDNPWLFPGQLAGRHKRTDTVAGDVKTFTAGVLQGGINPHAFRHILAVTVLHRWPGAYGLVARLLGHADEQTSFASYSGPERQQQFEQLHDLIDRLRDRRIPAGRDKGRRK